MGTSRHFDFCVPQAQRLVELGGVMHDLLTIQEMATLFLQLPAGKQDLTVKQALCVSVLTTYMRTRQSNGRAGVTGEMIDALPKHLSEAHEYFRLMRNKWAAHPVNEHERYHVRLEVEFDAANKPTAKAVGSGATSTVFLSPARMQGMLELVKSLRRVILRELQKEEASVLQFAQTIDLSELVNTPSKYSCKNIESPQAGKARSKF